MADGPHKQTATGASSAPLDAADAWKLVSALAEAARIGEAVVGPSALGFDETGALLPASSDADAIVIIDPGCPRGWRAPAHGPRPDAQASPLLDLYVPLCVGARAERLVIAHLGQSLDGRIATESGASQFITSQEDLVHTHRLRALCDAVIVGSRTAHRDNPKLTTRLATGSHPTRVIVDPTRGVAGSAEVFTDGLAPTLVVVDEDDQGVGDESRFLRLRRQDGIFAPADLLAALAKRGLRRIFVEGGGVTVSTFLHAGALDRLHVCVAPMILGSGRPAFQLPVIETLDQALPLKATHFASGSDILFDCEFGPRTAHT